MRIFNIPIAHRGLHNETDTENSMAAFKNALEAGYNIETDVHLTKDGKLVAFHDATLDRVVGKSVNIIDLTCADIDGDEYLLPNGEHIPYFEDLVALVDGKVDILVELKSYTQNFQYKCHLEKATYEAIKGKESWIIMQAFSPLSLIWFKNHAPEFMRGQLSANFGNKFVNGLLHLGGTYPMLYIAKPHFFAYDVQNLPSKNVRNACINHKMELICWTVRNEKCVENARAAGVKNIIFEHIDPKTFRE